MKIINGKIITDATPEERKIDQLNLQVKSLLTKMEQMKKSSSSIGLTNKKSEKLSKALNKSINLIKTAIS